MKRIEEAVSSRFTKQDNLGNFDCIWYEDGSQKHDIVKVSKINRDIHYKELKRRYDLIIDKMTSNKELVRDMVNQLLEDCFTEDSYFISISTLTHQDDKSLANALRPYYGRK